MTLLTFALLGLAAVDLLCPSQSSAGEVWRYRARGGSTIAIDTAKTGQIVQWKVKGKTVVDSHGTPQAPLVLETPGGGSARFQALKARERESGEGREVAIDGLLEGSAGRFPARLRYRVAPDAATVRIAVRVGPPDRAALPLKRWSWQLPFALEPRKRVYFQGDHGIGWESRYFYQFIAFEGRLLESPDRNEWRWFAADYLGPHAFRLWKAESETTSPLVMQEGRSMPPYVQLFDRNGGVTIEAPGLNDGSRRSLRVDASGGASAEVRFWSGAESGPGSVAPVKELFGREREIILRAAPGEAAIDRQRVALHRTYPPSPKPDAEQILKEPRWLRETPLATGAGVAYVTGGYPFPPGRLRRVEKIAVKAAGKPVPVQARPLAFWPDGSFKWVLLTFPIDPANAVAEAPAPRVSLRNGRFIPVELSLDAPPAAIGEHPSLKATLTPSGEVEVEQGAFKVRFAKGKQWMQPQANGQPLLKSEGGGRLGYADYRVDTKSLFPFGQPVGGSPDPGTLSVEKVTLEESGPLRAVVRLEGMTTNREPTRIILRATMLAGRPEIHLSHSAEFLFKDPRRTFLTGLGLELPLSGLDLHAAAFADAPAGAEADQLLQKTGFSRQLLSGRNASPVAGESGWVAAPLRDGITFQGVVRNFTQTAPKAISLGADGEIRFEIWPRDAGPMDVRRYSNYPHRGQGESTGPGKEDWVKANYYPNDPFVGVSRSHEVLFGFWPTASAPQPERLAADFQSPPLLYAGWETCRAAQVVLPIAAQADWPRAWDSWTRLARFWLYHRELHHWYGFWNFGDFRHRFRKGYGWIVAPEAARKAVEDPERTFPPGTQPLYDVQLANDWAYDNGRWGWSNSEGLSNLFLQNEYLRHGNRTIYFSAEAMARFCRDVVVRHDGQWLGLGTRHGVQHWSDGNHEERQTTSTEFRLHYFLSGEGRTRDTVEKLYRAHYSQASVRGEAAHGGRWGGLLFHWELTGSPEEAAQLAAYARTFIAPDGLYLNPQLTFPGPEAIAPPESLNANRFFFQHYGAMVNLLDYQQMFHDRALGQAIVKMADAMLAKKRTPAQLRESEVLEELPAIGFAALHADDPAPYRAFLDHYLRQVGWSELYQTVSENPAHWSGGSAFLRDNMPGCFFWNNWAGYLIASQGADTVWNTEIAAAYREAEMHGLPDFAEQPPGRWTQSQLDALHGPLADLLHRQQPWRSDPKK
ncbi:MAG TPA: hypothetical protein VNQ90_12005 [Chthoniobacteraceae bacterium]|nr:hypothetical protein [Chthoniobacteraceae bacterium]